MVSDESKPQSDYIERLLTRLNPGPVLLSMGLVVFLIALNRGIALLYGVSALVFAIVAVGYLFPLINLRRVEVHRSLPETACAGDTITVHADVFSKDPRPSWMLTLTESLPFKSNTNQPRILLESFRMKKQISYQLTIDVRGRFTFGEAILATGFPFGLINRTRPALSSSTQLLVYPTPFTVSRMPLNTGISTRSDAESSTTPESGFDEFHSIRDYQYGDSPRRVNWFTYAKSGRLAINQYSHSESPELHILLNSNRNFTVGGKVHNAFEDAITIALSISRYAIDHGCSVAVSSIGHKNKTLKSDTDSSHYQLIREYLVDLDADGEGSYAAGISQVIPSIDYGCQKVLFGFDEELPQLSNYINQPNCLIVSFNKRSYTDQLSASDQSFWSPSGHIVNIYHGRFPGYAFA